jgi:RNA polymerase sigma-70 factor (ECF subfamily)
MLLFLFNLVKKFGNETMLAQPLEYAYLFSNGDEEGFNYFFKKFYASLCLYANKMIFEKEVSEELVSTAFIKIWKHRQKFDCEENILSYLYTIVRNDCLKYLRKKKKNNTTEKELIYLISQEEEKYHFQTLVWAETLRQLTELIGTLSPQCSTIIRMIYVDGKTTREIADELHLSISTVKTQKMRGMSAMKKKLLTTR